jgi:hypothetical protein
MSFVKPFLNIFYAYNAGIFRLNLPNQVEELIQRFRNFMHILLLLHEIPGTTYIYYRHYRYPNFERTNMTDKLESAKKGKFLMHSGSEAHIFRTRINSINAQIERVRTNELSLAKIKPVSDESALELERTD